MISGSIPAVSMLRHSFSMYALFVHSTIFSLSACFVNSLPEVTFQIALIFNLDETKSTGFQFGSDYSRINFLPVDNSN
jgi:hypothetical protein